MFNISIFNNFSRITANNRIIWNIFNDNRPDSKDCTFSNIYITRDNHIRTHPYEITNSDMLFIISTSIRNSLTMIIIVTTKHYLTICSRMKIVSYFHPPPVH